MMWYKIENQQVRINIHAKPHAKKTAFLEVSEKGLHISIHAIPHKGQANKELIVYLSKLLQIPKSQILLQRGGTSHYKQVLLPLTDTVQELLDNPAVFIKS